MIFAPAVLVTRVPPTMIPGGPLVYIFVSPLWRLLDLVLFSLLVLLGFVATLPFLLVSVAQHGGKAFGYERLFETLSKAPLGAGSAAFGFLISRTLRDACTGCGEAHAWLRPMEEPFCRARGFRRGFPLGD